MPHGLPIQPPRTSLDELATKIQQTNDYLMWGTVDKAYKMLAEMNGNMAELLRHTKRLEEHVERLSDPTE